ncbi:MAG: T9SS type A sorting domain-containing protein [Prevotella sp.]|nr:T9SS type A sorting domain-containing protein [Prevotella sp.]
MAILLCIAVVCSGFLHANESERNDDDGAKTIVYRYDAAGNRISRGYNTLSIPRQPQAKGAVAFVDITQAKEGKDGCIVRLRPSVDPSDCLLSVHDLSGKLLRAETLTRHLTEYGMTGLRPGCYIVTVTTGGASHSAKVMITGQP